MSSAAFIKFLPNEEILDLSKLEAFADDKLNITQKLTPVLKMVKHIVERGKMHFLLPVPPPPHVFKHFLGLDRSNSNSFGKRLN